MTDGDLREYTRKQLDKVRQQAAGSICGKSYYAGNDMRHDKSYAIVQDEIRRYTSKLSNIK